MIRVTVVKKHNIVLFYTLSTMLLMTIFSYAYLLNKTIADVVYVEVEQKKQVELHSKLSVLENQYLTEMSNLTKEKAYDMGFVDDAKPVYVSLKNFPEALSLAETQ
ncbi:MAG: hypothetical protein AAB513_02745 [Patescibacteria group bacterium]